MTWASQLEWISKLPLELHWKKNSHLFIMVAQPTELSA